MWNERLSPGYVRLVPRDLSALPVDSLSMISAWVEGMPAYRLPPRSRLSEMKQASIS